MKTRLLRSLAALAVSGALSTGSALADDDAPKKEKPPARMPAAGAAMPLSDAPRSTTILTPRPAPPHAAPIITEAPDCPPEKCHAIGLFGDFLYLKARGVDVLFARTVDGCIPTAAAPAGALGNVQPTYSPGFRIGGFFGWNDSSLVATYTWFNSQANESVTAPENRVIQALVTLPNTANCASGSQASDARYDIDFQFADLDFRHALCCGPNYAVDWLVGVRYAHLDQDFSANFAVLGTTTVDTHINFDGIGPRIGLAGERIGDCGLLVYGRSSASFLAGHFSSTYTQQNTFVGTQANLSYDNDRIIPILDLELGVGWASRNGRFRVEAGYYVAGWFNTLTTPGLVRAVQLNEFSGTGDVLKDTLTFDGFTFRAAVKF
jgi:hypothetical protein